MDYWNKVKQWVWSNRYDIAIASGIFVVALLPRVLGLGTFLTADEKNWMGRSYEFVRAFKDLRLNEMLQTTHPGAIPLWLMGVSITAKIFLSHTPFSFQTLPNFIVAAQLPIALLNSLAVPAMYVLLRIVLRRYTSKSVQYLLPAAAALFVALDSFVIGYSKVAHVDATLMSFLFLAALATIIYVQTGYKQFWLIVSGVLSAGAVLTKAPAIFILPFWWFAVFVMEVTPAKKKGLVWQVQNSIRDRIRDFVLWLFLVGILFVIIWPVFITVINPKGNVDILRQDLTVALATPHHMSDDYAVNAWHYPAAILTRTNPIMLFFAFGGLALFVYSRKQQKDAKTMILLWGYIFFFVCMMTLGAKKGDRYILPVFPMIDVLAAIGLWQVIEKGTSMYKKWNYSNVSAFTLASLLVTALLGATVISYHPYEIAYANPLFPDNISQELGWGEGLEQVGAWISQNDPDAYVASWYPQELGYYTSANVLTLGAHEEQRVKYVVLYRNMFGRAPDHPANDYIDEYFKKRDPIFVAYVHGKPFAWVYQKQTYAGITGELLSGDTVSRSVTVREEPVVALEALIATYNDRARSGELVVTLTNVGGQQVFQWREPVANIKDDKWHRMMLPEPVQVEGPLTVSIQAIGTASKDAPAIRQTDDKEIAVRLLYQTSKDIAHEEQTRLFP